MWVGFNLFFRFQYKVNFTAVFMELDKDFFNFNILLFVPPWEHFMDLQPLMFC